MSADPRRRWLRIERGLLGMAVACTVWWGLVSLSAMRFQDQQRARFEGMRVATPDVELDSGPPAIGSVVATLDIPRVGLSAVIAARSLGSRGRRNTWCFLIDAWRQLLSPACRSFRMLPSVDLTRSSAVPRAAHRRLTTASMCFEGTASTGPCERAQSARARGGRGRPREIRLPRVRQRATASLPRRSLSLYHGPPPAISGSCRGKGHDVGRRAYRRGSGVRSHPCEQRAVWNKEGEVNAPANVNRRDAMEHR